MVIDFEAMDWSKHSTYKGKKIHISHETKSYIFFSFSDNVKGVFKLDKLEFTFG